MMGIAGATLLIAAPGDETIGVLSWIWPPALLALAYWTMRNARRDLRSRVRTWVINPVCLVLAIAAIGGGTERVLESVDQNLSAPAGHTYDVAGHQMYLQCTGTGSPTVLLFNGFGERSPSWARITETVSRDTRVCVYDRAGQGWSESTGQRDGVEVATDLHDLLGAANISAPYVLAGHSIGGTYAMVFAHQYAAEVVGMVLVDSATPEQFTALPKYPRFYSTFHRVSGVLPALARLGVGRLAAATQYAGLPSAARNQEQSFAATAREFDGERNEFLELPAAFDQAKALTTLDSKPLIVVTAGRGQDPGWAVAQDKLATLSNNASHRVVSPATHAALLYDTRFTGDSIDAINDVVTAARNQTQL
jgi:pimeloyl-ACP methyl ester carboxylesterase